MTGGDVEVVLGALDFQAEIPCEYDSCESIAGWSGSCRSCRVTSFMCDEHLRWARAAALFHAYCFCSVCKERARTCDELWEIRPVRS